MFCFLAFAAPLFNLQCTVRCSRVSRVHRARYKVYIEFKDLRISVQSFGNVDLRELSEFKDFGV